MENITVPTKKKFQFSEYDSKIIFLWNISDLNKKKITGRQFLLPHFANIFPTTHIFLLQTYVLFIPKPNSKWYNNSKDHPTLEVEGAKADADARVVAIMASFMMFDFWCFSNYEKQGKVEGGLSPLRIWSRQVFRIYLEKISSTSRSFASSQILVSNLLCKVNFNLTLNTRPDLLQCSPANT